MTIATQASVANCVLQCTTLVVHAFGLNILGIDMRIIE
jgi:hypothetical protein